MKIEREDFLKSLMMVKSGLSPREFIEQSSCFVFQNGEVMTFNDEIACRKEIGVRITGAVQASSLLAILEKLPDTDLKVRENEDGELEFRGKNKGFAVTKEAEVFLPIERVEKAKDWKPIPKGFMDAVRLVGHCVSTDESRFMLTCIHIHPEYIEACDNLQIMRYHVDTGVDDSVLVRGTSLSDLTGLGVVRMAQTKTWMHFQNKDDLTFSCRQYDENYPSLEALISFKGHPIKLPESAVDATDRAEVFAADRAGDPLVHVRLTAGKMRITGKGITGWYKEDRQVEYNGPDLEFLIAPSVLKYICEKYNSCRITDEKLKAAGKDDDDRLWEYVTVLGPPELEEAAPKEEEEQGDEAE